VLVIQDIKKKRKKNLPDHAGSQYRDKHERKAAASCFVEVWIGSN
jgi:hypothetical protein